MDNNESLKQELHELKDLLIRYEIINQEVMYGSANKFFPEDHQRVIEYHQTVYRFAKNLLIFFGVETILCAFPIIHMIRGDILFGGISLAILQFVVIVLGKNIYQDPLNIIQYLNTNRQQYKCAKQNLKKYEQEIRPQLLKDLSELNDVIIKKIELIKQTTNFFDTVENESAHLNVILNCPNGQKIFNTELLAQAFAKYQIEQEIFQSISSTGQVTAKPNNLKKRQLNRKSTKVNQLVEKSQ